MILITRLLAKQLRSIVKKTLGIHVEPLVLRTGSFGLVVRARGSQHAVEYHEPSPQEVAELVIPFALLGDVQGAKNEPVVLSTPQSNVLAASWEDHGISRTMQYALPKAGSSVFPVVPNSLTVNPPSLLTALRDAYDTTDVSSTRYALGCVQLRGKQGQIAATDGRQLLLQSGFSFGWDDERLVQKTGAFGCKELPQDQSVQIGCTEQHAAVRVGPWTFFLEIQKEGRFPRVMDVIPSVQSARTTLELSAADAEFFTANLHRLPGSPEERSVTVDLNGSVAIRATATGAERPAEIWLTNSTKTGEDVTLCADRRFLARVATLGFPQVHIFGPESAVLARDDMRSYVWVPLDSKDAVPASPDCLRIESPRGARPSRPHLRTVPRPFPQPTISMNTNRIAQAPASVATINTAGSTRMVRRRTSKCAGVLDQAAALRDQLRVTLTSAKELINTLKAERRNHKSLKQALASLKQLQAVA